jgi:DNA repair protein RadC
MVPAAVLALFLPIATDAHERAVFGYFAPDWRLLGMRHVAPGLRDSVTIPLRAVVADALAFDCTAVVMAHNHPSGDPAPSDADYVLTRRLARTLEAVGVQLYDHLVLARGGYESFRAHGLL